MSAPRFLISLLSALLLSLPVQALTVPMDGWAPVAGNENNWTDSTGQCLMREERHGQAFPVFNTPEEARAFALKLQTVLSKQMNAVVTQPVDRAGIWGVLAAYDYQQGGVTYRVTQLYLSDSGILRTITGSSEVNGQAACVNAMRDFIRYMAD